MFVVGCGWVAEGIEMSMDEWKAKWMSWMERM